MKYCSKCGAKLHDEAVICPSCGCRVESIDDSGSIGWGILGFLFPLIGLILYLAWRTDKPRCSKRAGKGALAAVIIYIILVVIYFIIAFAIFGSLIDAIESIEITQTVITSITSLI